jgi:hypothetical protein
MTAHQKDMLSVTGCRDWPRAAGMKLSYYACNVVAYSARLLVERQVILYYILFTFRSISSLIVSSIISSRYQVVNIGRHERDGNLL